jgi:glycosyltransferase involved in cell wall biosynthesis
MEVHAYVRCWNDEHILPYFFRHYDPWVTRYFIYDDGSTDESLRILSAHPRVEIRSPPPRVDPNSRIESQRRMQNEIWKESSGCADWVVVTDLDEHLHHENMILFLQYCQKQGVTAIPALGYEMVAEEFPASRQPLFEIVSRGAPSRKYSKLNLFNPSAILETNYAPGRHRWKLEGKVLAPAKDDVRLLHFHYVGFERVVQRHALCQGRQGSTDIKNGWGVQYSWSPEQLRAHWTVLDETAVDVFADEAANHPGQEVFESLPRHKNNFWAALRAKYF